VDTYRKPENFEWDWGTDDGGDIIKSLKVQKINYEYTDDDKKLIEIINNSGRCSFLRDKLGYDKNWH